jgi:hypothetical protein
MNIIRVKTADIKPKENNPRIIKDDKFKKLVKSIKEFPEMLDIRPIVVDENMTILGGNMRYKAIKEAGIKVIPIIKADNLTEEQKAEFIIKDNVGFGEWDWDLLANEWDAELLGDWGLDTWQLSINDDFDEAEDIVTNNQNYEHIDDISLKYLNADVKKFEIYIKHEDYDKVVDKLNHIKKEQECETNSDAIIWMILNC